MGVREPQPLPPGAVKPEPPSAPPPPHKLGSAGKDCSAAAAELLRAHREQERAEHFEEAAKLVEAFPCNCAAERDCVGLLTRGSKITYSKGRHYEDCPGALAAMLREKGGARG